MFYFPYTFIDRSIELSSVDQFPLFQYPSTVKCFKRDFAQQVQRANSFPTLVSVDKCLSLAQRNYTFFL